MKKTSPALVLNTILLIYVLLQFSWWAYLIYELNAEILTLKHPNSEVDLTFELKKKLWMILGEGFVFISLVLVGFYFIRKFVIRENRIARQERNFLLATTHELNSPIAAAKLNLQTLMRPKLSQMQQEQMIHSGLSNVNRLEKLVRNILTASRIDGGKFQLDIQPTSLKEIVDETINRHRSQLESANIDLVLDIPESIVLAIDSDAMELVFENLIHNTLKYAPDSKFGISACIKGRSAQIEVYDTGQGLDDIEMAHVFKKFYRAGNEETRSQKGTGLGLYLVKEVIRLHQGTIKLKQNKPSGLRFVIEIPTLK